MSVEPKPLHEHEYKLYIIPVIFRQVYDFGILIRRCECSKRYTYAFGPRDEMLEMAKVIRDRGDLQRPLP